MSSRSPKLPMWAEKVGQLRSALRLSQAEFGARLRYSAMAVSRWERGALEPTSEVYIQLGNLANDPDCWFFWERAGLRKADIASRLASERSKQPPPTPFPVEVVSAGTRRKTAAKSAQLFAIPVLDVHASGPHEEGGRVADIARTHSQQLIAATSDWCPHPLNTTCLCVQGNSMDPLIHNGDIVAVDNSQASLSDLNGKIVIASHKRRGLSIARFRKYRDVELLESENRHYEPIQIDKDRSWRIVGKVLWWLRRAP